jgi:geranylgeranyl reductase family protein
MKKVVIIGAGPAGSYCARLLAEQGFDVELFEEHKKIGLPVQCTGLVTKEIFTLIERGNFVVNELNGVKVIAPNAKTVEIPLQEFVIDRAKFDSELAKEAVRAGVKLTLGARFVGIQDNRVLLNHNGKIIRKRADILIGADGPLSDVAKAAEIFGKRKFYFGQQATVKGKFDDKKFITYFGRVAPDFFGWVVPESRAVARIGIASQGNARGLFENFVKKFRGRVIAKQAGLIPIFSPLRQIEACNQGLKIYLVGDAAGFVKATTGGGLVPGLKSAKLLAESIAKGKSYTSATRKLRMELLAHLLLRKTLNNFSEKDYALMARLISSDKVKKVLETTTRERPIKIVAKLAIAEPKFFRFALNFLRSLYL